MDKKDSKKARDALRESLKINPRYAPAWKALGNIFYENENTVNASKFYK